LGLGNVPETEIATSLNYKAIQISAGDLHSLILTKTNQLFSFGGNNYGQLGLSLGPTDNIFFPTQIILDKIIVQISSGSFHNLILLIDGSVLTFGQNNVFFLI
jgi:alpha-tubulin suppressor-like RCC1 family protein